MRLEGGKRGNQKLVIPPPLVSIITVVFRAKHELIEVIESVMRVKDEKTEFIVIDGGSDDGTLDLLRQYDSIIDYWVSEPDKGIYDAMNKGIAAAHGTFIFHLNTGDRILLIPTRQLEEAERRKVAAVAFRVSIDGKSEFRPNYAWSLRCTNTLHHQGTFFRRDRIPAYDIKYKIFADFDVNQRLALRGDKAEIFDDLVAFHATGGLSDIASQQNISEFFNVIYKNYGWPYVVLAWFFCKYQGLQSRLDSFR